MTLFLGPRCGSRTSQRVGYDLNLIGGVCAGMSMFSATRRGSCGWR
jgi:hypothetical protein